MRSLPPSHGCHRYLFVNGHCKYFSKGVSGLMSYVPMLIRTLAVSYKDIQFVTPALSHHTEVCIRKVF